MNLRWKNDVWLNEEIFCPFCLTDSPHITPNVTPNNSDVHLDVHNLSGKPDDEHSDDSGLDNPDTSIESSEDIPTPRSGELRY